MLRKILAIFSFGLAAMGAAFYLMTFGHTANEQSLVLLVIPNLLFAFTAIVLGRSKGDPWNMLTFPRGGPKWAEWVIRVLLLAFLIHFVLLIFTGTPIRQGNGFFKRSLSADMVAISQTEYYKMKASENRAFAFFWLVFDVALGLTLWFKEPRRKRLEAKRAASL